VATLMVEQSTFESTRVGELLSPDGVHILSQMLPGLGEDHLKFPLSVVSAWSSTALVTDLDGTELPWRAIDRVGLDRRLAQEAESQGAKLMTNAKVRKPQRDGQRWTVEVETDGQTQTVTADFLVDATGRASTLAKHFGAVRIRQSGQVALVGYLRCPEHLEVRQEMILETTANGWWYAAPIKAGSGVAVFITDSDLDKGQPDHAWQEALESSSHVKERFAQHALLEKPRRVSADSSLLLPSYGDGWMAVGDAASCFDPLSVHGLGRALLQGAKAGQYLAEGLANGETPNPVKLAEQNGEEFLKETMALSVWYRQVKQWPNSLFWQRRDQGYPSVETGRQQRRPKSAKPPLLYASGQRFECQQCGRCHRSQWPAFRPAAAAAGGLEPIDFPAINNGGPERPDFCQAGSAEDPRTCAQFPFILRETPDGIVVGVSPLCRSVQSGRGQPLEHYADWIRQIVDQRPPAVLSRKVAVTWGRGIEWSQYLELERGLLTSDDFDGSLRSLRWSLSLWACHPGQRELASPGETEEPESFLVWLENLLVGSLLCCLEHDSAANSSDLFRNLVDDKPVTFARVGWKGRFSELGASKRLDDVDWVCEETARYQRALVERKFLVIRTPLLHNLCLLSVLPNFLLTYALLLSMHRGAARIEREDYYRALELAETELVTYGRLDQLPHIIASFHLDKALEHIQARPLPTP
jgi:flavin-dependent dehydrogenase